MSIETFLVMSFQMLETGIDVIFLQLFSKESGEISGPARHVNV